MAQSWGFVPSYWDLTGLMPVASRGPIEEVKILANVILPQLDQQAVSEFEIREACLNELDRLCKNTEECCQKAPEIREKIEAAIRERK